MDNGDTARPLAHLSAAEVKLELVKLCGEVRNQVTRIDGCLERVDDRFESQEKELARTERFHKEALLLSSTALDKHLDKLNDHQALMAAAHQKNSEDMLRAQAELQSKDMADRDKKELEARIGSDKREVEGLIAKVDSRVKTMELAGQNLAGKLWGPLLVVAAICTGLGVALGAVIVKMLFPATGPTGP